MEHPTQLGRYEVVGLLGHGGMGAVYKAHDPRLDRFVAVKLISPLVPVEGSLDETLGRFRREAQAAGKLSHPNVVSVHDMDVDQGTGTPFIVMEYVDGVPLSTVLREHATVPLAQALEIVQQVGAALVEAHEHGIVHRDIKPANVFLDARGRVKVGDFGIARVAGSELTQAGVTLGTPGYLAPEVLRGATADARSDVFALGVLAYQLLAGRRPFDGPTPAAVTLDVIQRVPDPPRTLRPEVPSHVSTAVMRALDKLPETRTPTVAAFLRELQEEPETKAALGPPASPPARSRGRLVFAAVAGAIAVVFGLGALLVLRECAGTPSTTLTPSARPAAPAVHSPPLPRSSAPARTEPAVDDRGRTPPPVHGRGTPEPGVREAEKVLDDVWKLEREADRKAQERAREEARKREEKASEAGKKQGKGRRGKGRKK
ncbi:MAG TPA: protein kinase [Vicinamibacteria bacterium]|nr:protein kinase [Vicinamibacteria bacterium]